MSSSTASTPRTSSSSGSHYTSDTTPATSVASVESLSSATKEAIQLSASSYSRSLVPRYTRRAIVLTPAQESNPPVLPPVSPVKACRRTLYHTARSIIPPLRRASVPLPRPIDPQSLQTPPVPLTLYTSPIALPLPKGPAPCVPLFDHKRSRSWDPAVCPGW